MAGTGAGVWSTDHIFRNCVWTGRSTTMCINIDEKTYLPIRKEHVMDNTSADTVKPKNKRVTRKDIAELAGVSVSAVSRAINNSGYVSKDAKKRILDIAARMNYTPNPIAASLQEKRTKLLIFFCKDLHNSFYIDVYQGMVEEAKKL